jgi:hypothetical protein
VALVDALETKSVIEHLGHYGVTVELGPKLEMTVFAEETETQGQLERLRHLGRGSARATSSCCGSPKFPTVDHRNSPGDERRGGLDLSLRNCQVGTS